MQIVSKNINLEGVTIYLTSDELTTILYSLSEAQDSARKDYEEAVEEYKEHGENDEYWYEHEKKKLNEINELIENLEKVYVE